MSKMRYWYFGYGAGLDFSTDPPTPLTDGAMLAGEGCSVISDSLGNLLFYTNGVSVFNKNHTIMPNGSGLNGHDTSTQSALIVPKPGSISIYYIFTTDRQVGIGTYYSEVDMTADGGLGDVTVKNVQLRAGPMSEKVAAIRHSNNTDFWVVFRGPNTTNRYYVYPVTHLGIQLATTYDVGTTVNSSGIGYLAFSPDGTKLAAALFDGGFELYDFNTATGAITNATVLLSSSNAYGVCFSPNSRILYGSHGNILSQWDLTATNIPSSRTVISGSNAVTALQRGINGKLYASRSGISSLAVIDQPNVVGTGSTFHLSGQNLNLKAGAFGLPNFPQGLDSVSLGSGCFIEKILSTDCLGNSRIKINNNFACVKTKINELRSTVLAGPWSVNLDAMPQILGTDCIGDSLTTINANIDLLKEALIEIKTTASAYLSGMDVEFDEIAPISGDQCIGDSRLKLNFLFEFLTNTLNSFDSNIP